MLTGIFLFSCTAWFWMPELPIAVLMLVPLIADGTIQLKTSYESKNSRRAWTGFLFGYGLIAAQVQSMLCSFRFGYGLTH